MTDTDARANHVAVGSMRELTRHIAAEIARRQVHPSRCVVLFPNPALAQLARIAWCQWGASGFAPHFETGLQSATRLGAALPGVGDLSFDMGLDRLGAQPLLAAAGLGARPELLAMLIERAHILGRAAAAAGPDGRSTWAIDARSSLAADAGLAPTALDHALSRIAVEWCAASLHATDILFQQQPVPPWDLLVLLEGVNWDPLPAALACRWADRCLNLSWRVGEPSGEVRIGAALDGEDEAEWSAAAILGHLEAGRGPVALVANDRQLTRRVAAQLHLRGVALQDETGWKLSTTRVAAGLMSGLRACSWNASSDQVLEWLKASPAFEPSRVLACEQVLRREGEPQWQAFHTLQVAANTSLAQWLVEVDTLRSGLRSSRPLVDWLQALEHLLEACGILRLMQDDSAGQQVIRALRLHAHGRDELARQPAAYGRWSHSAFEAWVDATLESGRFLPVAPEQAQVVVLPLAALMGREFGVVVMPGCDARHLSASPDPDGPWTGRQNEALGLPSRDELGKLQRLAWSHALAAGCCDLLWHEKESDNQPVTPSPLLRELQFRGGAIPWADPRPWQQLVATPGGQPRPMARELVVRSLSASAYEDLRRCPYRFFALRQLGLSESEEIDQALGKRDFGTWLHEVLRLFHESLPDGCDGPTRKQLLDSAAQQATVHQHLDPALFLPFRAVWPNIRSAYLTWLDARDAQGVRFESAELQIRSALGDLTLQGTIDRVDRKPDGTAILLDYKTEREDKVRRRVADPGEDTQLAFYAVLLDSPQPEACYLAVGERGEVKAYRQPHILWARDALRSGIEEDMRRIHHGASMAALGEGASCEHCAARGLCRKDFWESA